MPLKNWAELDQLGFVAKATIRGAKPVEVAGDPWLGSQPEFKRLEWVMAKDSANTAERPVKN
jgi:hypothetical protein